MQSEFKGMGFKEVYNTMKENLNITNIQIEGKENISNDYIIGPSKIKEAPVNMEE